MSEKEALDKLHAINMRWTGPEPMSALVRDARALREQAAEHPAAVREIDAFLQRASRACPY